MNVDEIQNRRQKLDSITDKIIGCVYNVSNRLGCGFLEKVYENALTMELRKQGLNVKKQHPIKVKYDGVIVGEFAADLLIEEGVLVELKAATALADSHMSQCLNYVKATRLSVCLLVNFGRPKAEIKRIVNNF